MFIIKRDNNEFGPFSSSQVIKLYTEGRILSKDIIRHENTDQFISVIQFLEHNNLNISQETENITSVIGNLFKLLGLFTKVRRYISGSWNENKEFLLVLLIVLIPVVGLFFIQYPIAIYCIYGLYFASIWSIILYKTIATDQVELKKTIIVFAGTIILSAIIISGWHTVFSLDRIIKLTESSNYILTFVTMFLGVALIEEFCKQILIYWTIQTYRFVTLTRSAIFYGMVSGIAFGVFEGIEYQIGINKSLDTDANYFFNLLRITSLPFFHAIWAGIGAYLISLSFILLKYRYSLRILAWLIPSFLHASYNTFGFSPAGILVIILSIALLISYLTKSDLIVNQLNLIQNE
jgi:RsiW-degrading membrane proteinase PrsW (M82 family)